MVYVIQFCLQLTSRIRTVPFWSCTQAVSKPVWHIPLLRVQWKTPDDGQRNCLKHVDFYVYWNVHHLDSWVKIDQFDVTCFIISLYNAQHVSDVNTSILRSLRLICSVISWVTLIWIWYHNVTPTHIEPDQCNPRNNSTNKSQAPEDVGINIRNMLSIK